MVTSVVVASAVVASVVVVVVSVVSVVSVASVASGGSGPGEVVSPSSGARRSSTSVVVAVGVIASVVSVVEVVAVTVITAAVAGNVFAGPRSPTMAPGGSAPARKNLTLDRASPMSSVSSSELVLVVVGKAAVIEQLCEHGGTDTVIALQPLKQLTTGQLTDIARIGS